MPPQGPLPVVRLSNAIPAFVELLNEALLRKRQELESPATGGPRAEDREEPYTWKPHIKPREPCEHTHKGGMAEKAHTTQQVVASRMGTDEL